MTIAIPMAIAITMTKNTIKTLLPCDFGPK
jgi:hypothetical protein